MDQNLASWLREVGRLSLRYFAVGLSFAPWGLIYALLALSGWVHWSILVLLLGAGLATAHVAWQYLDVEAVKEVRTITMLRDHHIHTITAGDAVYVLSRTKPEAARSFRVDPRNRNSIPGLTLQRVV